MFAVAPSMVAWRALAGSDAQKAKEAVSWLGPMTSIEKGDVVRFLLVPGTTEWVFNWWLQRPELDGLNDYSPPLIDPDDPSFPLRAVAGAHEASPRVLSLLIQALAVRGQNDDLSWMAEKLDQSLPLSIQNKAQNPESATEDLRTDLPVKLAATTLTLATEREISDVIIPQWLRAGEARAGAAMILLRWVPDQEQLDFVQQNINRWKQAKSVDLASIARDTMNILTGRDLSWSEAESQNLIWNESLAAQCESQKSVWCPKLSACTWGRSACILEAFGDDVSLTNACLRSAQDLHQPRFSQRSQGQTPSMREVISDIEMQGIIRASNSLGGTYQVVVEHICAQH